MESSQVFPGFSNSLRTENQPLQGVSVTNDLIEFRYCPTRVLKWQIERKSEGFFPIAVIATLVVLLPTIYFHPPTFYDASFAPIFYVFLFLITGVASAKCINSSLTQLAGRIAISQHGIQFTANNVLCPWRDLITAEPFGDIASNRRGGLRLIFDSSNWTSEDEAAFRSFLRFTKPGRREIEIDFRVLTESERQQTIDALRKFVPETRLHQKLRVAQKNDSFTRIWLNSLDASPKRASAFRLEPGTILENRYEILNTLASGGQATAYLATDHFADIQNGEPSVVVLKEFVLPVHAGERSVTEMLEEVASLTTLMNLVACNQVVKLYRTFTEDFRAYLVLEHVPGKTLRELVSGGTTFTSAQIVSLARQMARMLVHLHSQQPPVIHRDFAPDNLILMPDGVLKLIDFDVAYRVSQPGPARVVGKPSYMAPEQFRGLPCTQSDLYSLGACLHFLITSKEPVPVSTSRPRSICADTAPFIDDLVALCTTVDLSKRIQNAQDLERHLENIT